ncbi:MAG: hypothetical protein GDA54_06825 [Alphaproteobacteria bacterium GM7ARS4]|nr:hypothetical protein [Alphaproteobacteria bacterium GM7ARS4]
MNKLPLYFIAFALGVALSIAPNRAQADVEPDFFDEEFFEEEEEFFEEEDFEEFVEEEFEEVEYEEQISGCILDTEARLGILCDNWSTRIIGRFGVDALFLGTDSASDGAFRPRSSGAGLSTARIGVSGTLYRDWVYKVEYDFVQERLDNIDVDEDSSRFMGESARGQITDAYIAYRGIEDFTIRVGNMKAAYSLAMANDSRFDLFMENATAMHVYGNSKPRYPGIAASYYDKQYKVLANVGVHLEPYNIENGSEDGDDISLYGRVSYTPYLRNEWYSHVGIGGTYVARNGDDAFQTYTSVAPFTTAIARVGDDPLFVANRAASYESSYVVNLDLAGGWRQYGGQLGLTRMTHSPVGGGDSVNQHMFYVQGNWWLTEERNAYDPREGVFGRIVPIRRLGAGGMGAVGVSVRYHRLLLDDSGTGFVSSDGAPATARFNEGGRLWGITAAVMWKPNPYVKFVGEYVHVERDAFACGSVRGAGNPTAVACLGGDTPSGIQFRALIDF